MSPSDGRHLGLQWLTSSSRRVSSCGLGDPKKPRSCESAATVKWGGDRGVRGTDRSGACGRRTPRVNPSGPPKRIERRETLGPPVSWSWVQAHRPRAKRKLRRDAGNR